MGKMIAYCGLICTDCPTYLATKNDDDAARAKTAAFYAEAYGFDLEPEDINCDGCLSKGGKLIAYCQSCDIRKCCKERKNDNCAVCDEQPCDKLVNFHKFSPEAKACFDSLVEQLQAP